jgi:hypothetical protein
MSCDDCEAAQRLRLPPGDVERQTFVRVGTANVAIVGCHDHELQLIDALRHAQALDIAKGHPVTTWTPEQLEELAALLRARRWQEAGKQADAYWTEREREHGA